MVVTVIVCCKNSAFRTTESSVLFFLYERSVRVLFCLLLVDVKYISSISAERVIVVPCSSFLIIALFFSFLAL